MEQEYLKASILLREFLLAGSEDVSEAKSKLRLALKQLDVNNHGCITSGDLRSYISSHGVASENSSILELLIEQVDINRDGKIEYSELGDFLWPEKILDGTDKEFGLILQYVRKAVIKVVGAASSNDTDEALLEAFAKIGKAHLRSSCLLDTTTAKKIFRSLNIPEIHPRRLKNSEIELLGKSIDANNDGVVSAREFHRWLFAKSSKVDQKSVKEIISEKESFAHLHKEPVILQELSEGNAVEARFGGGKKWFKGRVRSRNSDGTFNIVYDDMDEESNVSTANIRLIDDIGANSVPREMSTQNPSLKVLPPLGQSILSPGSSISENCTEKVEISGNLPDYRISFELISSSSPILDVKASELILSSIENEVSNSKQVSSDNDEFPFEVQKMEVSSSSGLNQSMIDNFKKSADVAERIAKARETFLISELNRKNVPSIESLDTIDISFIPSIFEPERIMLTGNCDGKFFKSTRGISCFTEEKGLLSKDDEVAEQKASNHASSEMTSSELFNSLTKFTGKIRSEVMENISLEMKCVKERELTFVTDLENSIIAAERKLIHLSEKAEMTLENKISAFQKDFLDKSKIQREYEERFRAEREATELRARKEKESNDALEKLKRKAEQERRIAAQKSKTLRDKNQDLLRESSENSALHLINVRVEKSSALSHYYHKEFVDFKNKISKNIERLDFVVKKELKNMKQQIDELTTDDGRTEKLKHRVIEESKALRRVALEFRSSLSEEIKNIERTRVFRYITQYKASQLRGRSLSPIRLFKTYVAEHEKEDRDVAIKLRKSLEERRIEELEKRPRAKSASTRIIRYGWGASIEEPVDRKSLSSFKFGIYRPENYSYEKSVIQDKRQSLNKHQEKKRPDVEVNITPVTTKMLALSSRKNGTKNLQKADKKNRKDDNKSKPQLHLGLKSEAIQPPTTTITTTTTPPTPPTPSTTTGSNRLSASIFPSLEDVTDWWKTVLAKKKAAEEKGLSLYVGGTHKKL